MEGKKSTGQLQGVRNLEALKGLEALLCRDAWGRDGVTGAPERTGGRDLYVADA